MLAPALNPDGFGFVDRGLGKTVGDPAEDGKFRVPTLRNVEVTAPYMHNGVFKTMYSVLAFYNTRDVADWPAAEVAQNVNTEELGNLGLTNQARGSGRIPQDPLRRLGGYAILLIFGPLRVARTALGIEADEGAALLPFKGCLRSPEPQTKLVAHAANCIHAPVDMIMSLPTRTRSGRRCPRGTPG